MAKYYDFFLSYASRDRKKAEKDDLDRFADDLFKELQNVGRHDGFFYAPANMQRGGEFELDLATALTRSRVMVAMYSPNYFGSPYCGKEWQAFRQRQEENTNNPPIGVTAAPVILPVVWTKDLLQFPNGVPAVQFKLDSDPEEYQQRGLRYLMQSKKYNAAYRGLIERLGSDLAQMAISQGEARDRESAPLDEIDPPFPKGYKRGLGYVRYVFLAGNKADMKPRRKQVDSYGNFANRQDWRPCFPDLDRLAGAMAQRAATEANKEYEFVEPSQMVERVNLGRRLNNVVAIVADPWSLKLPDFAEVLKTLSAPDAAFPNTGVLVTWNQRDNETLNRMPELKNVVTDTFSGIATRQVLYNEEITSEETLRAGLMAIFNAAQGKLVERGELPSAQIGPTPGQPVLNVTS